MVLFTESAMELDEKQFGLTMDIYSHDIHSMLDMYSENCYLEETASTDDEKSNSTSGKKSVMQTIIAKLKSMIAKVGEIIDAFKASIEGNKNLTAEEYMGSETAKIQFAYDCEAIQKEVDMEYLEARKIVSGISSITKLPIEKVAAFCDKMDAKLHENKDKFLPAGKAIVTTIAIEKTRKSVRDKICQSKDITNRSKKILDDFEKASDPNYDAKQMINKMKKIENPEYDDTQKKLSLMTRFINTVGKMEKRWIRISNTLDGEYSRNMKKK